MKNIYTYLTFLIAVTLQAIEPPNILFIFSDDHAIKAISAYGGPLTKVAPTPNIDRLANEGVVLLGPVTGAHHNVITPATNLEEILKEVEAHTKRWKANVDQYIEKNGIQSPLDTGEVDDETTNWPEYHPPNEIDLSDAGIRTIIWATGFEYNYEWIKLPVTDDRNYPIQRRGVTKYMGLYFMGLQWMHGSKSAQFIGVGEDAEYVANHVAANFG